MTKIKNSQAAAWEESAETARDIKLMKIMDRPIAFHRAFVDVGGSVTSALFLSQAVYWQARCDRQDGWWYKDQDEWQEETGMGRREQETARKKLKSVGVLEEKKEGIPARLWYRVNVSKLSEKLGISQDWRNPPNKDGAKRQTRMADSDTQAWRNPPSRSGGKRQTFKGTETTTETTTEITTTTGDTDRDPISSSSSSNLIFDFSLANWPTTRREHAAKTLDGLDLQTAQAVLDELNEAMSSNKVSKPISWLQRVADRARAGEFHPTSEIADRRQAAQQQQSMELKKAKSKPSKVWNEHKEELREWFQEKDFNQNIQPLRGLENGQILVLQAPNPFVADWVQQNLETIQDVIGMHTDHTPEIRISIG